MNIFFDLDGTLLNSKTRLYCLFCDITQQTLLSYDDYWELKRALFSHQNILKDYFKYSSTEIELFEQKWLSLIETKLYLSMDILFPFTSQVLDELLAGSHELYLVTSRQDEEGVHEQLKSYHLEDYFCKVFVTKATCSKTELLLNSGIQFSKDDLLVGDTGMDVKTAQCIGVRSLAVLSGFRNRSILLKYKPDYIENDIQSIVKYV